MHVDYVFVPEDASAEEKFRSDVLSYAGRLLELVGRHTLIVGVGFMDKPFVYSVDGRLCDVLDELRDPGYPS